MHLHGTTLKLSATDLSNFLGCRHRTALNMAVACKQRPRPPKFTDPLLELLYKRGLEQEKSYVDSFVPEQWVRSAVEASAISGRFVAPAHRNANPGPEARSRDLCEGRSGRRIGPRLRALGR